MEYLSSHLWQIWAVVAVVFLIAELGSGSLYLLCFAVGAAASAVVAAALGLPWQLGVFALASLVSVFTVRPLVARYLHRDGEQRPSNTDALLGRTATVSEAIEAGGYGRVSLDGDDWKAEAAGGVALPVGAKVRVVGRESVILSVEAL